MVVLTSIIVAELLHDAAGQLAAAGIDDGRLESEVLLAHAMGIDRAHLLAAMREAVPVPASASFASMLGRRLAREPLAYITGRREFYGIDFACGPVALIPRPETEMLVDVALAEVRARGAELRVVDVGTGSGAIAVTIAVCASETRLIATETSPDALAPARENARRRGVADRVELHVADLLAGAGQCDVILANLPYVSESDWRALPPEIRDHEPRAALAGGPRGTEIIERLLRDAPAHLAPGGVLACEIGDTQGNALAAAARSAFPSAQICVEKDLAGHDRVLVVRLGVAG
jgi:release factor glutamine methyltransferase